MWLALKDQITVDKISCGKMWKNDKYENVYVKLDVYQSGLTQKL